MSEKNPGDKWLNGEISAGRLSELCIEPSDLIGSIWHAFGNRIEVLRTEFESKLERAKKDLVEAEEDDKEDAILAESCRIRVYTECLALLRLHLVSAIERTGAATKER